MRSHYALTGTLTYYRTLPTFAELRNVEAVVLDYLKGYSHHTSSELAGKHRQLKDLAGISSPVDMIEVGKEKPSEGPFNFSRWKDAPHVALANLRDDAAAVLRFTRTYGVLERDYKGGPTHIALSDVFQFRDVLRRAWEGNHDAFLQMLDNVKARLWVVSSGVGIDIEDLRTLIQVMFARDRWDRRTKKCANPDCAAPYFLAVRKGQKFCSHGCAVLINVRRFRASERKAKNKQSKN